MRTLTKVLASVGVTGLALATFAGTAMAEPPSTPSDSSIVAVGSDTIQALGDQFQADYDGFFSYDATGSATITPKVGCSAITRPNGSGAGIAALAANAHPSGDSSDYCIDVARSSRVLSGTDPVNLAGVPIAGDAVTWSAESSTNLPANLSTTELNAIYTCNDSAIGGSGGPVRENEIGGTGSDPVVPVIPQSASGTRAFFLSQIGVTALGSCVVPTDNSVEENEGTNVIFGRNSQYNTRDIVFPYSIAVYLSQTIHGHGDGTNNPGNLQLKSVGGTAPTKGNGNAAKINKAFPYQRQVFLVIRSTGKRAKYVPAYLQDFLGKNNGSGFVCSTQAENDAVSYGFLTLGAKCGKVDTLSPVA